MMYTMKAPDATFSLIATFLLFDFVGYWFHRLSHESDFLWRFHQIHHMDEEYAATTGVRVHLVEDILHSSLLIVFIMLINVPMSYFAFFKSVAFLMALFHHSNIRLGANCNKILSLVIVTPSIHAPHHHESIEHNKTNFGFIFSFWDRMFATYNDSIRNNEWRMGLKYAYDQPYIQLMIEPFRKNLYIKGMSRLGFAMKTHVRS